MQSKDSTQSVTEKEIEEGQRKIFFEQVDIAYARLQENSAEWERNSPNVGNGMRLCWMVWKTTDTFIALNLSARQNQSVQRTK